MIFSIRNLTNSSCSFFSDSFNFVSISSLIESDATKSSPEISIPHDVSIPFQKLSTYTDHEEVLVFDLKPDEIEKAEVWNLSWVVPLLGPRVPRAKAARTPEEEEVVVSPSSSSSTT